MRRLAWIPLSALALLAAPIALAVSQAPAVAQAPAGATGVCNDGSYTRSATKRGACSHHGGVKQWLDKTASAPASTKTPSVAPSKDQPAASATKVWVNTPSMVYHCPGTRWYGTTKKGSYMTEAEAKAAGARPSNGKKCS
jgi:hypothetical protein